ncbi:Na+/H+ antiporter subunit E [Sulfidibacter corallicola]|uniref:Na+/H+ antiporter subunit E n=1 Tax=Sulfidibacter corallicola TaxID=2818388 RepID=UPI003B22400B
MGRLLTFSFLFVLWMVFSGQFDSFHLGMGVVSAALVTGFTGAFHSGGTVKGAYDRLGRFPKLIGYFVWLVLEVFKANLHVFTLAFRPNVHEALDPQVIRFKTSLKTDFAKFVLGNSITLTPGTVTLMIEGDEFVVHAITRQAAADLPGEMERRVAEVFEA